MTEQPLQPLGSRLTLQDARAVGGPVALPLRHSAGRPSPPSPRSTGCSRRSPAARNQPSSPSTPTSTRRQRPPQSLSCAGRRSQAARCARRSTSSSTRATPSPASRSRSSATAPTRSPPRRCGRCATASCQPRSAGFRKRATPSRAAPRARPTARPTQALLVTGVRVRPHLRLPAHFLPLHRDRGQGDRAQPAVRRRSVRRARRRVPVRVELCTRVARRCERGDTPRPSTQVPSLLLVFG